LGVRVKDTGVDIAQEALGTIFEVFRQHDASTTRSYNGVGLGLYVAKNMRICWGATIPGSK
jgi:signal transduction histidine kinase